MATEYLTVSHLNRTKLRHFFSKVHVDSAIQFRGVPCWVWTGSISQVGYGNFRWEQQSTYTHRIMYAWVNGPIPCGMKSLRIDHLCRNRACCNPVHLDLVPARINSLRGATATKTHCKHGHPLSGSNLIYRMDDRTGYPIRQCLICYKERIKRMHAAYKKRYHSDPVFRALHIKRTSACTKRRRARRRASP